MTQGEKVRKEGSINTLFRVVDVWSWKRVIKKVGTDEIRTREVSHHGLDEPKRDAITTRPQYREDETKEEE